MKHRNHIGRRVLALVLALMMCMSMLQITAFAAEEPLVPPEVTERENTDAPDSDKPKDPAGPEGGDDVDVPEEDATGPHGGTVEDIENGTRETWDTTDEDGVRTEGSETITETTVPVENGSTTETNRDLEETVTNPTETNPDGSTVTTGTGHTEGEGSSTTTTTTTTDDPQNPQEPVEPTEDAIDAANKDSNTEAEQVNPGNEFETDPTQTLEPSPLPTEDMSTEGNWLGEDGITVTMKPGTADTQEIEANIGDWEQSIRDKMAMPADAKPYTPAEAEADQIDLPEGASAWKDAEGKVTIVTPQYNEDQVLTGYKTQTIVTSAGPQVDDSDKGSSTLIDGSVNKGEAPVREESKTSYTFELPEAPKAGSEPDENGNTVTTTVKELLSEAYYVQQGDGTYVLADKDTEGAVQVVVGYLTEKITTDSDGKTIGTSSRSDWGVETKTVTTPLRTENSAQWNVIVEHYTVPITRAITTENWLLTVDNECGGTTCQVWGQMGKIEPNNSERGQTGLVVDLTKQPDVGKTDTSTDLYHRKGIQYVYEITAPTLNIRPGPNIDNDPIDTLNKGDKVGIFEISSDGKWGRIGNGKWICIAGYAEKTDRKAETGQFLYLGEYALESAIRVNGKNEFGKDVYTWQPHQFIIYDDSGQAHYVYCADFEVSPRNGANYGETVIDGSNTVGQWSDDEEENKKIAQKVQAIALSGYWGTSSGTGSLASVKEMMIEAIRKGAIEGIREEDVALLTDGMALTATQAAIWSHATSGQPINSDDPFGQYNLNGKVNQGNADIYFKDGTNEERVATALYNYLRSLDPQESYQTKEIKTITETSITVKELATEDGKPVVVKPADTDENTAYQYKTDVSFVLETVPSQINDDLLVVIKDQNGKQIGSWRLVGDDSKDETKGIIGKVVAGDNGKYTIPDVVLAEGVTITLSLKGTQLADKSAYLITAKDASGESNNEWSQTFVGVKDVQRDINVSVDLTFNVREPVADLNGTTETEHQSKEDEYKKEVTVGSEWNTYQNEVVITASSHFSYESDSTWELVTTPTPTPTTPTPSTPTPTVTPTPTPFSTPAPTPEPSETPTTEIPDETPPLTDIPDETPPLAETPREPPAEIPDQATPLAELPDEDVPLVNTPSEELVELPEDPVPLADVPKTGDVSILWYAMTLLCGAGLVCLLALERKERRQR